MWSKLLVGRSQSLFSPPLLLCVLCLCHSCSPPGHLVPLHQLIHNYPLPLSAFFFTVSPLFPLSVNLFYLSHPSSSPLPSFTGLLIHLLSTFSLINMPPRCLTPSYLYYSVEMSSSRSPISFWLFLPPASSLYVFFHVLNRWISGRLLTFTSEALLSTDRQFVCLKASRTQRSIFCVNVWAGVPRSLSASAASLSMSLFLCVPQPGGPRAVVLVSESLAGSHAGLMGPLRDFSLNIDLWHLLGGIALEVSYIPLKRKENLICFVHLTLGNSLQRKHSNICCRGIIFTPCC